MNSGAGDTTQLVPGYPIRTPWDHSSVDSSPRPIAASHVLHRPLVPRHPPSALSNLTTKMLASTMHISNNTRKTHHTPTTTNPTRRQPTTTTRIRTDEPAGPPKETTPPQQRRLFPQDPTGCHTPPAHTPNTLHTHPTHTGPGTGSTSIRHTNQ